MQPTNDSDGLLAQLQASLGDAFLVERELKPGGMSRLFLATERSLSRRVVVKVLPPESLDGLGADRFKREAELLAQLQHPHIVPVLGAMRAAGIVYYIMPYVDGDSLAVRLARDGPFDVARGVTLIREIADALGHAHSHGVVHRDIKPANVLLAAGHAVVTDFGIAHVDASYVTRLTSTGIGLGTVGYMAPEQLVGAAVDARADIYALGVVGYELLTGRSPFATSGVSVSLAPQLRGNPAHPQTVRSGIPGAVGDALLRALSPDPDARFSTMAEFRRALDSGAAPGRRRLIAAGAAALVVCAIVAAFALRGRDGGAPSVSSRPDASPQSAPRESTTASFPAVSRVAIAPFDVLRPDLGLWREGLVDILSRNLDGMGDVRTIAPTTVLQSWHGRSDAAGAAALGKAVHAEVVVYGVLRGDGDSVRAEATLYDVAADRPITAVERRDVIGHVDRLADSLTVEVVRALGGPRGKRGPYLRSVGTRSMPALKAFLQGEQYFRRSAYDSAESAFRLATEIDTGFALAYHGRARAFGWIPDYPQLVVAARAAAARNRGLSEHDSLAIAFGAVGADYRVATTNRGSMLARVVTMAKDAIARYPADGELRYLYGDIVFHAPAKEVEVLSAREQLDLFDAAIAADSGLGEAYTHAMHLAVATRDVRRLDKYFAAVGGNSRITGLAQLFGTVRWFVAPTGRNADDCQRWADTVSYSPQFGRAFFLTALSTWVDSAGSVARCLEALARREPRAGLVAAPVIRARGRLALANTFDPTRQSSGAVTDLAILAMLGAVDADSTAAAARPYASDSSAGANQIRAKLWTFWAWRRDTAAITTALTTERRLRTAQPGPVADEAEAVLEMMRRALFALVRGDTSTAIRAIERGPHLPPVDEIAMRGVVLPPLYERAGRVREARALLERPSPFITPLGAVLKELRVGRLSEQLGDRARAAAAYSYVLDAFNDAEPLFSPFTRDAAEGLRRTGTDTRARTILPKP